MLRTAAGFIIYKVQDNTPTVLLLFNGRWSPPKGGKEKNESDIQNALRETFEETGISENDINIVDGYKYKLEYSKQYSIIKKSHLITLFLCEIKDPEFPIKISSEHSIFKWMTMEEASHSRNDPASNHSYYLMYKNVFARIKDEIAKKE